MEEKGLTTEFASHTLGQNGVALLSHVAKVFEEPDQRVVFADVNLRFRKSEFVAVLGPVGSGKTTLLRMISGLDKPTSGNVNVFGRELAHIKDGELVALRTAHIGYVPQVQALVNDFTVYQNVELPLVFLGVERDARAVRVSAMLETMGMSGDAGRRVKELSVGERQLVSIARALVVDPQLLLMDEPTEALDPLVSEVILGILRGYNALQSKTLIVATHDKRVIELASRNVRVSKKISA